jgi:hypothetical protein
MGRRSPRRTVVWSLSAGSSARYRTARFARPGRARRIRRCVRIGALLTVIGLVRLAHAARLRWRPLLAGAVLTAAGVILRSGPGSLVFLPGILLLLNLPLMDVRTDTGRRRLSELRRELAGPATAAQRFDLEATLDRYPDAVTHELRDILARQALAPAHGAHSNGIPGARSY